MNGYLDNTYGQTLLYCEGGFWGLGADRAAGFLFVKFLKACSGCTVCSARVPYLAPDPNDGTQQLT